MTAEAKELYNYIMSKDEIKESLELNASDKRILYEVRAVVDAASVKYRIEYCTNNENPFTLNDRQEVTKKIVREITNFDEEEFNKCKDILFKFRICDCNIFETYEIVARKNNSHLEVIGLFAEAWKFVLKHTYYEDETFDDLYNNLSGEREYGRFECYENYEFHDTDYYVSAFVISGSLAWAEVWSKSLDKTICYIRLETL